MRRGKIREEGGIIIGMDGNTGEIKTIDKIKIIFMIRNKEGRIRIRGDNREERG
jgi:hypothetical protein